MKTVFIVEFVNGITLFDQKQWPWALDSDEEWLVNDLTFDIADSLGLPELILKFKKNYGPMPAGNANAFDSFISTDVIEVGLI